MNKDTYVAEGSSCNIKADSTSSSTISSEIESITDNYVEIKIQDPKTWMYNKRSEHQAFNVICDLQKLSNSNGTERRTTRPIKGGGPNDGFINGGGVVVVNTDDLTIKEASVKWKKPPMTYDVSFFYV